MTISHDNLHNIGMRLENQLAACFCRSHFALLCNDSIKTQERDYTDDQSFDTYKPRITPLFYAENFTSAFDEPCAFD